MPPKKVNKTVKKTVQVKTPRRRTKNEKSLPQTDVKVKTKPSEINSTNDVQDKDRVVNLTKNDINIMLANEVVERQFPKKSTLPKDPTNEVVLELLKTGKTKPTIKRKRLLKNNLSNKESTCKEKPIKRNIKRPLMVRKFRNSPNAVQKTAPPTNKNESVPESHKSETKKLGRHNVLLKQEPVKNNATTNEDCEIKPKTPRRKLTLNRKAGPLTRKKANEVTTVAEPLVSPENISPQKENKEIADTNISEQNTILRRQSEASVSELSWTKDISSSSTTTCATVSSKDFFRIDNKLPIIKLTNIDQKLKNVENQHVCDLNKKPPTLPVSIQFDNNICEKSAIENCDKNSDKICEYEKRNEKYDDELNFPSIQFVSNLSTSSSDSDSDDGKSTKNNATAMNKLNETLEKLSSKLKNFDLEIINWIGYRNEEINPNIEKIQEKLFQDDFLKEEMNVIVHCRSIKRILSTNNLTTDVEPVKSWGCNVHTAFENTMSNENIDESHNIRDHIYNSFKDSNCQEQMVDFERIEPSKEEEFEINQLKDGNSFDDNDDDAISLDAESMSGLESSTKNSKVECNVNHLNEEYVPKPISNNTFKSPETIKYHPTKIIEEKLLESSQNTSSDNVCEKQNADSTSIYREQDKYTSFEEKNAFNEDNTINEKPAKTQNSVTKLIPKSPILMGSIYKPTIGVTSMVFKGVCFFNLISKCKKNACKFPHISLEVDAVKSKLLSLSDTTFIQEYMLLRCWPCLRLNYGMCFVEECIRRKLTRIVVEMAFDFIVHDSKKITHIVIDIVETILLYLNNVDLCVCEDILMIKITSTAFLLCDFFIDTIAESQNFSRFKNVFVRLTDFMYRNGRTFRPDVAAHVLERIVILPYDEGLARALIQIIRNTEACIFSNPMIGHLEKHLINSNMGLYDEFCYLKDRVLQKHTTLGNCYPNTAHNDIDRINSSLNHLDKDKRYSPDTTNLDHLTKTTIEPKFTRTIDLNKINFLNVNGHMSNSSSSESEDKRFTPKNQFNNWRVRKPYDKTRHMNRNPLMRPPLRPPFKRRSDQSFGGSPSKYQRRNEFYFF